MAYELDSEITNAEDLNWQFELKDGSGSLIDLSGYTIEFNIANSGLTEATTTNGMITVTGTGTFTISYGEDDMSGLVPGRYPIGCRYYDGTNWVQLFVGALTVIDGNMP